MHVFDRCVGLKYNSGQGKLIGKQYFIIYIYFTCNTLDLLCVWNIESVTAGIIEWAIIPV